MIKKLILFFLAAGPFLSMAQNASSEPAMADTFRQEGKIYVVIAVMATVFLAVLLYLVMLEKRLKKLEKEVAHRESTGENKK